MKIADLKQHKNWINWNKEVRDEKETKVPYATNGKRASSTDESTWDTYENAVQQSDKIGFVLPNDATILAIDLDHCVSGNEITNDTFKRFVEQANTYTEYSPSGDGLHLLFYVPNGIELQANRSQKKCPDFECYSHGRYLTFTGFSYGKEKEIREINQQQAEQLLSIVGYPWKGTEKQQQSVLRHGNSLTNEGVKTKMFNAKNGAKIESLWNGNIADYNNDTSAADYALCCQLAFWTGKDTEQMRQLWLASPLGNREKTHNRKDYQDMTIENAIEQTTGIYQPKEDKEKEAEQNGSIPERDEYFAYLESPEFEEKTFKKKQTKYKLAFHKYFAIQYPHLLYEIGEEKTYWIYNQETGVYDELNISSVRALVIKLLIEDGLEAMTGQTTVNDILARYRAMYSERGVSYDDFDTNNHPYFHVANGWVNVNTGEFEPHSPQRLSRRKSSVSYDPNATCPTYDRFLDEQINLKKDQVRVIDQFSGYLLTPYINQQKMLALIGPSGSGKSTLLNCWKDVLGDCATEKSLTELSGESARFSGSSFVGKQLCWFDEVEVTRANMGSPLINLITGEHIRVERKGITNIIEAPNQIKSVLTANTLPRSAEIGVYRRLILIYTNYSFTNNLAADSNIREKLQKEASGILNRMIRGLADLNKHGGFTVIEGHDDLIEDYKTKSNTVAEFLDEYFEPDRNAEPIPSTQLLNAYKEFANDYYSKILTPQRFGAMMYQHGLAKFDHVYAGRNNSGVRAWYGLKLKKGLKMDQEGYIWQGF